MFLEINYKKALEMGIVPSESILSIADKIIR